MTVKNSYFALWKCTYLIIFIVTANLMGQAWADTIDSKNGKDTTTIPGAPPGAPPQSPSPTPTPTPARADQNPNLGIYGFSLTESGGLITALPVKGNFYIRTKSTRTEVLAVKAFLQEIGGRDSDYATSSNSAHYISRADSFDADTVGRAACSALGYKWDPYYGSHLTVSDVKTGSMGEIHLNYGFGFQGAPAGSYLVRLRDEGQKIIVNGVQKISELENIIIPQYPGSILELRGREIWLPVRRFICVR